MARDPRFDGRFFVAVKTTKIFCRPICPANLPKEENVEYFEHSSQALEAGYRPCLRCRPDSAPQSWAWKGTETTFQRAMSLIDDGALQQGSLAELSERLGISDRYLRQLFNEHLGLSPKQYALYQQLMFAKQLLHTSQLSITDVAYASGFNSVRRFNDAFVKSLKLAPNQVRKDAKGSASNTLTLSYRGQLNWQHMLDFYRLRALDGIETVIEDAYQRRVEVNGQQAWFSAKNTGKALEVEFEIEDLKQVRHLVKGIRRLFDLDADTDVIESHLKLVSPELVSTQGIRIPGVWSTWEAGVRAILGQQVSVKAAIGQLNLLAQQLNGNQHFPTISEVANADLDFLRMPQSRKETLKRFAIYNLDNPNTHPQEWLTLKGIGPWTVSYALLRGLSEPDCLLDKDLIVKRVMDKFPSITTAAVSPWGSYATFHCWSHTL
ncbi:DNA-3-methyladenine glycosylase 2 family protein [Vibrio maerlii]|uniref:DNA-3-methyladenine glycosylase 2 family protein n=1 Tax=Vibrio maerlii TaxID=2231648 RepID=UPI001F12A051|nr:AlkA N-terminal domain-containing protein [Vibrio maerlii]